MMLMMLNPFTCSINEDGRPINEVGMRVQYRQKASFRNPSCGFSVFGFSTYLGHHTITMRRDGLLVLAIQLLLASNAQAFVFPHAARNRRTAWTARIVRDRGATCRLASTSADSPKLSRVPPDLEGVPIPYVDFSGSSFIECYADSVATVNGVEYTIGVPCDYAVALCYQDEQGQLVPIELEDSLMDDLFPVAESIVAEGAYDEVVRVYESTPLSHVLSHFYLRVWRRLGIAAHATNSHFSRGARRRRFGRV